MVYTCTKCGKPTMRAYTTSDGYETGLCSVCLAEYEKELKNKEHIEVVENAEQRINKKIKDVIKTISFIKDRMQEHENKNGNLEKRIEKLEQEIQDVRNSLDALSEERVKQITKNILGEHKNEKS